MNIPRFYKDKLYLHNLLCLPTGSTPEVKGRTAVKAGSMLDDNNWHDMIITRDRKKLKVVVARLVSEVEINCLFYTLNLDKSVRYVYIELL